MLVENTPVVVGRRIEEGTLLNRYHTEIFQSYTKKTTNKVFASYFLQGPQRYAHEKHTKDSKAFESTINSVFIPTCENNLLQLGSVQKTQNLIKNTETYPDLEPCVQKVKPFKKKTRKLKSNKKRRAKSTSKKRKIHKLHENLSGATHNHSINVTRIVAKSTDITHYPELCLQQRDTNQHKSAVMSIKELPPTISPYAKPFKFLQTERSQSKRMSFNGSNQDNVLPSVSKPKSTSSASVSTSPKKENFLPAPHPPKSSNSPKSMGSVLKKTPLVKLQPDNDVGKHSLEAKNFKKILHDNSLKDRLSLIHSYGSDYMTVANQYEAKRKKEAAQRDYQEKIAEKAENEKKKVLQRKKIYALNRLMTRLEDEQFQEFMRSKAQEKLNS